MKKKALNRSRLPLLDITGITSRTQRSIIGSQSLDESIADCKPTHCYAFRHVPSTPLHINIHRITHNLYLLNIPANNLF